MKGRKPNSGKKPTLKQVEDISPPSFLQGVAREKWEIIAPALQEAKVLTEGDLLALESYCMAYQMSRQAHNEVQQHGILIENAKRGIAQNPACAILKSSLAEMRMIGAQLGLDPVNRGKLDVSGDVSVANPFDDL